MLSSRVRYALGALAFLARRPTKAHTTERIAAVTGAPLPTLAKILQTLGRAGIIRTIRGPGGGIRLHCDPARISVLDVVKAIDTSPYRRMLRPDALGTCLYRRLDVLLRLAELVLSRTTIAELSGGEANRVDEPGKPSVDEILARVFDAVNQPAAIGESVDAGPTRSARSLRATGGRSVARRRRP